MSTLCPFKGLTKQSNVVTIVSYDRKSFYSRDPEGKWRELVKVIKNKLFNELMFIL
jgi:hypothetical protein